jgi:ferrous iron transport protein B
MASPTLGTPHSSLLPPHLPTVALVGNPNTGKTTLFNALAGMRQRVGNYPGVTVETKKGRLRGAAGALDLIDLPGTYSLAARSPDEMVAVNLLLGKQAGEPRPDAVVTIVDASNLERNLYLTTQVLELGVPVVVALNMMDVAHGQGITIDTPRLARQLGVAVVPMQANKKKGLAELKEALAAALAGPPPARAPDFPAAFDQEVAQLRASLDDSAPAFLVRRLLIDAGGHVERFLVEQHGEALAQQVQAARLRLAEAGCAVPAVEARARYGWIREVTAGCIRRPPRRVVTWTDRLDRILTHRTWGTLLFLALMFLVFQALFSWARPLMDGIKAGQDWLAALLSQDTFLSPGPLRSLLVGGIVKGVGSVLVFLPQIVILFGFIAVLEDCGYMARAAFLMDRLMSRCGLSGKSFIPMLSSVACAVPGIMAARVIENRRDRLATVLVAPLMSCSARLPVYTVLIGAFLSTDQGFAWWVPGLTLFGLYLVGLVVAPLVALALKRTLLRGETPTFVLEMPMYKWPSAHIVLHRMGEAGWMFVRRAGTLILASMIVIWALLYFPATTPQGTSYDQETARLEAGIRAQKERRDELEEQIAPQQEELEELQAKLRESPDDHQLLARKLALEKELAPTLQALEPLNAAVEPVEKQLNELRRTWTGQSLLGRAGKALAPVVRPLGWDWRIGMAALASFPAREVFVGTMGIIYNQGEGEAEDRKFRRGLQDVLRAETWDDEPERKVFTVPVALSVMIFFALCCQCVSTLAVIRRETNSWRWPLFTFTYMTVLAYLAALAVYQVGSWLS